jgi:hypothetical protein
MLVSPLFPIPPPALEEATVLRPFFGLPCRLGTSCPFAADPLAEAELAGLAEPLGIRGGGIAKEAEDAVLDTVDGRTPVVVVVGLRDISLYDV